ncbi:ABC transporter C family member 4 [Nymphaea thermarum]|nr:ABC transporter C family member 4 [Nymphaea thermarum]
MSKPVDNGLELLILGMPYIRTWVNTNFSGAIKGLSARTDRLLSSAFAKKECVRGVLKNKTILLVTHQVDFLHNVDIIMVRYRPIYTSGPLRHKS